MKRSQMIEAIKQCYKIGVFDCENGRANLEDDAVHEAGEIILACLMLDGVFDTEDMEED